MTITVADILAGRWGLSKIMQEADGGFITYADLQGLGSSCATFYPPWNGTGYALDCALVRLRGTITAPADENTKLFPRDLVGLGDVELSQLTPAQRTALANVLTTWLTGYSYVDYTGAAVDVPAFSTAAYTGTTTLKRVAADIYQHFGHNKLRPRAAVVETHNTLYTDDFSTDPSARWTQIHGGSGDFVWDSVNEEVAVDVLNTELIVRYDTSPGSIEHESQVTCCMFSDSARNPGPSLRVHSGATVDAYLVHVNTTGFTINRWNNGTRTQIYSGSGFAVASGDFGTVRAAASGANGANVVIDMWLTDHNSVTKPTDPAAFIGVDGSPDDTYTDTSADRLDDATVHTYSGIGARFTGVSRDEQIDYFRVQAISDRGGGGGTSVDVPVGSLALTGYAPTVSVTNHQTIAIPAASINPTGYVPTIQTHVAVSIPLASLALTGYAPTAAATNHQSVDVPAASLTLTGYAPDAAATNHQSVSVPAASLTLTGYAPAVVATDHKTVAVPVAALTLTGYAAVITTSNDQTIEIPVASLALTGYAVTPLTPRTVNVPAASLTLTGYAPSVGNHITVEVPVGSIVLTGLSPTVNITEHQYVEIPLASLGLTGFAPGAVTTEHQTISIPAGSLTLTGYAPAVVGTQRVAFLTAVLTITPKLDGSITVEPKLGGGVTLN